MRSDSILAATLAIATVASAEVERPRFYFPRHIKRVTSNGSPAAPNHARANLDGSFSLNQGGNDILSQLLNPTGSGSIPPIIVQPTPTPAKTSSSTKSSSSSSHSSTTSSSSHSSSHSSAITFGPGGVVTTTAKPTTTSSTSSDSDDLLGTLLGGLFGPGTASSASAGPTSTTASTTSSAAKSTSESASTTSTTSTPGGWLGLPSLTLPPLFPSATPTPSDASNSTSSTAYDIGSSSSSGDDWLSSLLPLPSSSSGSTGLGVILSSIIETGTSSSPIAVPTNGTSSIPIITPSVIASSAMNSTGPAASVIPVTPLPSNGTITASYPLKTTSGTSGPPSNGTAIIPKPTSTVTLSSPALTPTPTPLQTSAPVTTSTTPPPQSIAAIGTMSGSSSEYLPGSIVVASSATGTGSSPASVSTGVASSFPRVISPPNGPSQGPPADSTLIQIGFLYALNYQFVVGNSVTSAQIFQWLPQGLADGLGLKLDQIVMKSLVPLDTSERLGYTTTLALAYVPSGIVDKLANDLHIPTAAIYNDPSTSVNALMNLIDPSVPLTPGSNLQGGSTSDNEAPATTDPPSSGVFNTEGQQKQSSSSIKSTAGIATGVVGAAASYGVAMFFIARRYKKRRQSHRRSSSTFGGPEMVMAGSPQLVDQAHPIMAGGRTSFDDAGHDRNSRGSGSSGGHSARTQQISGPMMAENSLGWN